MDDIVKIIGCLLGFFAVLLGAFAAHRLKRVWSAEALQSFETGVRYQMYHAIVLLLLGFQLGFSNPAERMAAYCFIAGTLLFSGSIYLLCYASENRLRLRLLGPMTPLGGLLLLTGWALLLYLFLPF